MYKKMQIRGLALNIILLFLIITIITTYKTPFDIIALSQKYFILDITLGILFVLSCLAGPVLLIIGYLKDSQKRNYTLLISFTVSLLAALLMKFRFDIEGIRVFHLPSIFLLLYLSVFIVRTLINKKKENKEKPATEKTKTDY